MKDAPQCQHNFRPMGCLVLQAEQIIVWLAMSFINVACFGSVDIGIVFSSFLFDSGFGCVDVVLFRGGAEGLRVILGVSVAVVSVLFCFIILRISLVLLSFWVVFSTSSPKAYNVHDDIQATIGVTSIISKPVKKSSKNIRNPPNSAARVSMTNTTIAKVLIFLPMLP